MSSDPSDNNRIVQSPNQVAHNASSSSGGRRTVKDDDDHLDDSQLLPPRIYRTSRMLPAILASDEDDDSPLNLTININAKPRRSMSDSQLIVFKPNVGDEESLVSSENVQGIMRHSKKQRSGGNRSRNLLRRLSSLLHRKEKKSTFSGHDEASPPSDVENSKDVETKSTSSDPTPVTKQLESKSNNISRHGYAFKDVPTMQSMSSISFSQASKDCNSILDNGHYNEQDDPIQGKDTGKNGSKSSKTLATVSTTSSGFLLTCMDSAIDTFSEGVSCCKSSGLDR